MGKFLEIYNLSRLNHDERENLNRSSLVVKNPPANSGYYEFDSCSGKILHAEGQLSLWATTMKPVL